MTEEQNEEKKESGWESLKGQIISWMREIILVLMAITLLFSYFVLTNNYLTITAEDGVKHFEAEPQPEKVEEQAEKEENLFEPSGLNLGWAIIILVLAYGASSIQTVKLNEKGVILFLEKLVTPVDSGPHFVPRFIMELKTVDIREHEIEVPGEPEQIYRLTRAQEEAGEDPNPPPGKVLPVRVTFRAFNPPEEEEPVEAIAKKTNKDPEGKTDDPLSSRVTAEMVLLIRYAISDFVNFLVNIGDIKLIERILQDVAVAEALSVLQVGTLDRAMTYTDPISKAIEEQVREAINKIQEGEHRSWGISLLQVQLKPFVLSHQLSIALQSIPESKARATATIRTAEGRKRQLELEGKGQAEARFLMLEAEARGTKQLAEQLGITEGQVILAMQTLREGLQKGQHTYFMGANSMADMIFAGLAMAKQQGGSSQ